MDRYTYRTPDGSVLLTDELDGKYTANEVIDKLAERLAAYEDTELDPELVKPLAMMCAAMKMEIDRLRNFNKQKKDGQVAVLPCKPGDAVYSIKDNEIVPWKIYAFLARYYATDTISSAIMGFGVEHIGKTIFLTHAEAEAALAKDTNVDNKEDQP